jgi:flavin reductase (DIM6/NTAB) family NADH-FMN oxidoreductase RutF
MVFISTIDGNGIPNVATVAYVTFIQSNPPVLALGLGKHRTLRNICTTREFVVNVPDKNLAEESWIIGELFSNRRIPRGINKFDLANLTRSPAQRVKAPLVGECFAHLECRAIWIREMERASLVLGEVVAASYENERFDEEMIVRKEQFASLLLVSGSLCSVPGMIFSIDIKNAEKRAQEKLMSFHTPHA